MSWNTGAAETSDCFSPWLKAYGKLNAPAPSVALQRLNTLLLTLPSRIWVKLLSLENRGEESESVEALREGELRAVERLGVKDPRGFRRGERSGCEGRGGEGGGWG